MTAGPPESKPCLIHSCGKDGDCRSGRRCVVGPTGCRSCQGKMFTIIDLLATRCSELEHVLEESPPVAKNKIIAALMSVNSKSFGNKYEYCSNVSRNCGVLYSLRHYMPWLLILSISLSQSTSPAGRCQRYRTLKPLQKLQHQVLRIL